MDVFDGVVVDVGADDDGATVFADVEKRVDRGGRTVGYGAFMVEFESKRKTTASFGLLMVQ